MQTSSFTLAIIAALLTACSTIPSRTVSESEVLALTKRLAVEECRPQEFAWGTHVTGCRYSAQLLDGKWSVLVDAIILKKDSSDAGIMGAHSLYVFSTNGTFIDRIPGM